MNCLGCDRNIPWDGKRPLAYTCPCGATVFYEVIDGRPCVFPPISFLRVTLGEAPPHIDYYLGKSSYWSEVKQKFYDSLRSRGAVWSWECEKCRERTVTRALMEREHGLYRFDFHPNLAKILMEVS